MDTAVLHDVLGGVVCQAQLVRMRFDPAQCDFDTLFEHVTELACELHAPAAWHIGHFDEKYAPVATCAVGHETSHDSGTTAYDCQLSALGQYINRRFLYLLSCISRGRPRKG